MNPALPSGVHAKTLDLYDSILGIIGQEGLVTDAYHYLFGLLPFFEYSSTSVRESYLKIIREYFLPSCESLTDVLPALIAAMIPGLEEASDQIDQVLDLMIMIENKYSSEEYVKAFTFVFVSTPPRRSNCIYYLALRQQRKMNCLFHLGIQLELQQFFHFSKAGLEDSNLIVTRGTLDYISTNFLLENADLSKELKVGMIQMMLHVLTRKDMSLTRRFYSWLNPAIDEHVALFKASLLKSMEESLMNLPECGHFFKILACILDNGDLSAKILPSIIEKIIRSVYSSYELCGSAILLPANQFFEIVDLYIVWTALIALTEQTSLENNLMILKFSIENLKIYEPGIASLYLKPLLETLFAEEYVLISRIYFLEP